MGALVLLLFVHLFAYRLRLHRILAVPSEPFVVGSFDLLYLAPFEYQKLPRFAEDIILISPSQRYAFRH